MCSPKCHSRAGENQELRTDYGCKMKNMDQSYMTMALELARRGIGSVEPNPAVGCVIVKDGNILGQGFHQRFGGPHAEINALADCRKNNADPAGATAYVTLEPCCHTGKTGPCTDALIAAQIARVAAAVQDPTSKVAGKGIEQLRHAGIEVFVGVCENEAKALNAPFFKHAHTALPWVVAKWAQSIDGKLSWQNPPAHGNWISCEKSRLDVHHLRRRMQAILVGVNTIITDNPRLTVRIPDVTIDRQPLRVVLDSRLQMPWESHLITTPEAPTMVVTTAHAAHSEQEKMEKLQNAGIETLVVSEKEQRCDLSELLVELGRRGVQQLLVEGGATVLSSFLREKLVDEVNVYIAPLLLGKGGIADLARNLDVNIGVEKLIDVKLEIFDSDVKISGRVQYPLF